MDNITIKIIIESKLNHLSFLRHILKGICFAVTQNEQFFQDIELAVNEALSNVIHHAYHNEPDHEIEIAITLDSKEIVFQIADLGLKNLQIDNPSIIDKNINNMFIDSIPENGRGLFLIHQLMDEVVYKTEKGKNILILRKYFKQKS